MSLFSKIKNRLSSFPIGQIFAATVIIAIDIFIIFAFIHTLHVNISKRNQDIGEISPGITAQSGDVIFCAGFSLNTDNPMTYKLLLNEKRKELYQNDAFLKTMSFDSSEAAFSFSYETASPSKILLNYADTDASNQEGIYHSKQSISEQYLKYLCENGYTVNCFLNTSSIYDCFLTSDTETIRFMYVRLTSSDGLTILAPMDASANIPTELSQILEIK